MREREDVRGGRANILVHFTSVGEHDERDLGITEDGELLSLLENPISSLGVGHLPVCVVFDQLDLNLPTTHVSSLNFLYFFLSLKISRSLDLV